MNKSESKYFNTAVRMDEALISLLEKKDFEYITVKEICETANVNRSTFYLHYETIVDLLSESMEYMNKRFLDCFESDVATTIAKIKTAVKDELIFITQTAVKDELIFITPEYLNPYLKFIKDNRKIFVAALEKPEIYDSNIKYDKLYVHIMEPVLERFDCKKEKRKFVISFYVHGIMGIVNEWIKGECEEEIIEISEIITELIIPDKYKGIWSGTDEKGDCDNLKKNKQK